MPRVRKTPEQRLAELQAKQHQIAARIRKESAVLKTTERKKDTRRKILAGAVALAHCEHDADFMTALYKQLGRQLEKPEDRALFGLDDPA